MKLEYKGRRYHLTPRGLEVLYRLAKLRADLCVHDGDGDGASLEVLNLALYEHTARGMNMGFHVPTETLLCLDCGNPGRDHRQ